VRNRPADRRRGLSARVLSYSLLSLAAVWLVTLPQPAQAQAYDPRYPVCMKRYQGPFGSEWIDCSYTSLPQCRATASGLPAMCVENPYFVPAADPPRRAYRRHRHAG
jgi:uncharacterized protein DUF3551